MSVIADALKKAQRERMKRSSGVPGSPLSSPVVVRLRSRQGATFSWIRALGIGVGAAIILGGIAVAWQLRSAGRVSPLPAVPPPPVAERIVEAKPVAPSHDTRSEGASHSSSPIGVASAAAASSEVVAAREPAPVGTGDPRTATPQGVTRTETGVSRIRGIDRLRISVEQPRHPEYVHLFEQATLAHRSNDTAAARSLYERLLVTAPDDADLLNNFGVLLSGARDFERGAELLQRAVALAPRNAGAWANLGFLFREQGRPSQSIAAFQRALALDPRRPGVRVNIAQQYIAMGSIAEARDAVDRLLADEPTSAEAHYTSGQLFEIQGDRASAVREYAEFLRLAPPRLTPYMQRVRQHLDSLGVRLPDDE